LPQTATVVLIHRKGGWKRGGRLPTSPPAASRSGDQNGAGAFEGRGDISDLLLGVDESAPPLPAGRSPALSVTDLRAAPGPPLWRCLAGCCPRSARPWPGLWQNSTLGKVQIRELALQKNRDISPSCGRRYANLDDVGQGCSARSTAPAMRGPCWRRRPPARPGTTRW
jgi:hypothetical protein